MIIGQDELVNYFLNTSFESLPRTSMLIGPKGSGKHSLLQLISENCGIQAMDVSDKINLDLIEFISVRPEPFIYYIEADKISEKDENTLLKLLEEPLSNTCIFILCNHESSLLPTVQNRCYKFKLKPYSQSILKQFIPAGISDEILQYANTPGQLINMSAQDLEAQKLLANNMFFKIKNATVPNTLSISEKFSFKNEKNKFDFNIFLSILHRIIYDIICNSNVSRQYYLAYKLTNQLYHDQFIPHIDQRLLFENYLLQLKKLFRDEN